MINMHAAFYLLHLSFKSTLLLSSKAVKMEITVGSTGFFTAKLASFFGHTNCEREKTVDSGLLRAVHLVPK